MEQYLEGGKQQHVERRSLRLGQLSESPSQLLIQTERA